MHLQGHALRVDVASERLDAIFMEISVSEKPGRSRTPAEMFSGSVALTG